MNEQQRKSRSETLRPRLESVLGARFTPGHLTKILDAEDQMTENREHLTILCDRGVLSENELSDKLNRCFEVFVRRAAEILGEDACRRIYDYGPGEKIDLVAVGEAEQRGWLSAINDIREAIALTNLRGGHLSNYLVQRVLETTRTSLQRMTGGELSVELFGIGEDEWVPVATVGKFFQATNVLSQECKLSGGNLLGPVEELVNRGDLPGSVVPMLHDERIGAVAIWRVHVADFASERQMRPTLALYVLASDSNAFADDLARYVLDQSAMLLGFTIEIGQRDEVLAPSSRGPKV